MSVQQRGSSSWQVRIDLGFGQNGKRIRKIETVKGTKTDAKRRERQLRSILDKGLPIDIGKTTVAQYLETWLTDVVSIRNRPRTQDSYQTIVRKHIVPRIGNILLVKLQPSDVQRLEAQVRATLSASTTHHVHVVLAKALKDAMRKGLVSRNVCLYIEPPRLQPYEVKCPGLAEIDAILAETEKTPYGTCYRFITYTGLRRGEAVALKWQNIDLERGVVSIVEQAQRLTGKGIVYLPPKSGASKRGIAVDQVTINLLRDHRGQQLLRKVELDGGYSENDLVFPGPLGNVLDPSVLTRHFEKATRKAGYPGVRLHDLRHFYISGLYATEISPLVVQKQAGHASAAFTMQVYGHVSADSRAEGARRFAAWMKDAKRTPN